MHQSQDRAPADADELCRDLGLYISNSLLREPELVLEPKTPLLEFGVLNSMNLALLTAHIHERYGVNVPPAELLGANFKDLAAVAAMVLRLRGPA